MNPRPPGSQPGALPTELPPPRARTGYRSDAHGPVAQWIERWTSNPRAEVRFLPGPFRRAQPCENRMVEPTRFVRKVRDLRSGAVPVLSPQIRTFHDSRDLRRDRPGRRSSAEVAGGRNGAWVGSVAESTGRFSPGAIGGGTCRILVTVDDPDAFVERALAAGATETSPVAIEHGWRLGRIVDPFGHEWEIGRPPAGWPSMTT